MTNTVIQSEKKQVVGRRKTAAARIRIKPGTGEIIVNNKDWKKYFPSSEYQTIILSPLQSVGKLKSFDFSVKVAGGGMKGQAEALQLGISRALASYDEELKKTLKSLGYLTRDPRAKERKKPGLKRARRAPQWSKR